MDNRLFVFVLQKTESDERTSRHSFSSVLWHVFEMDSHSDSGLGQRGMSARGYELRTIID